MEEEQIKFFEGRTLDFKLYKLIKIGGDIPYYKYNPDYKVTAEIGDLLSVEDRYSLWHCYFTLLGVSYDHKIARFENDWSYTFKDTGDLNYKGGRYIEHHILVEADEKEIELDFNIACNLLCAYNPVGYNCDIPHNSFSIPILAGEQFVPHWQEKWLKNHAHNID